jgi:hypothetical protein
MNVLKAAVTYLMKDRRYRFRDRRAHYASDAMKCKRDRFWERTNEPVTNPTDLTGMLKMRVGSWIEKGLIEDVIKNLHLEGVHFLSGQVPIGGSNPNFDGLLDAYVVERNDKEGPYVIEVKTKSGVGADFFKNDPNPGDYMAQMGLYLKDLHGKTGYVRGCFYFVLLSDANFGEMVQVDCFYEPSTDLVIAHRAEYSDGSEKKIHYEFRVGAAQEGFEEVDKAVAANQPPVKGDYEYKKPLTPEYLSEISDYQLRAAINGEKILGDWHTIYSRYFNKQLEVDGTSREYTDFERQQLLAEYRRRHPKSKIA